MFSTYYFQIFIFYVRMRGINCWFVVHCIREKIKNTENWSKCQIVFWMQRTIYYLWALPGHKLLLVPDCNLLPPKTNMSTSEFSVNNYPHTWQVISCNYQAQLFKDKSDLSVFNAISIILFGICWGTWRFVPNEFSIKAQFLPGYQTW